MLIDNNLNPLSSLQYIVRPEGFDVSTGWTSLHCITTSKARADGKPLRYVLACLADGLSEADLLVAHNMDFDFPVVNCEFIRSNIQSTLAQKLRYCTMKSTTDLCSIPGKYGSKWPKLEELYRFLFTRTFSEAHRAMHDVKATTECYLELRRRGIA